MQHVRLLKLLITMFLLLLSALAIPAQQAVVTVDAGAVMRTFDRHMLLGSNIATWYRPQTFANRDLRQWLADIDMRFLRMPGGSYADCTFWNGNGVRRADGSVDPSRLRDGFPQIDYSAYAPSVLLWKGKLGNDWNGHVDVLAEHEFIKAIPGAQAMVTVNAGTGRAVDAAEWVRWANITHHYAVHYWEIGNELDGDWEDGHTLPGGGVLTGALYAARFKEFATAMKAVDPSIMVGGPTTGVEPGGFAETLLRDAGDTVDFVSIHNYPCLASMTEAQMLDKVTSIDAQVRLVKAWIHQYQPRREGKIAISVSEWNVCPNREACDLFNTLWSCRFIGEMAGAGVDSALQWDTFTTEHGMFQDGNPIQRKAQYWAFWLWDHYMGNQLLHTEQQGPKSFYSLATRSQDAVYVMLINTSRTDEVATTVHLTGVDVGKSGEMAVCDSCRYFWNALRKDVEWSEMPRVTPLHTGADFPLVVPPFSAVVVKAPLGKDAPLSAWAQAGALDVAKPAGKLGLKLVLPENGYADTRLEGWVLAVQAGGNAPYPAPTPPAALSVDGPAQLDRTQAPLAQEAGQFYLIPTGEGEVTVTATVNGVSTSAKVHLQPSVPQPVVLWPFDNGFLAKGYLDSPWKLSADTSARANKSVARIAMPEAWATNYQRFATLKVFPNAAALKRENIRGVVFDLYLSPDFQCADPNAHISVVMQSTANYWMNIGDIPLPKPGAWHTVSVTTKDEKLCAAMSEAYNVILNLYSVSPVHGSLCLDKAGLMVR